MSVETLRARQAGGVVDTARRGDCLSKKARMTCGRLMGIWLVCVFGTWGMSAGADGVGQSQAGGGTNGVTGGTNSVPVIVMEDRGAMVAYEPQLPVLRGMVNHGLLSLTGKQNLQDAWLSLVTKQDVVGVKVHSGAGLAGTRVAVAEAVVESMLSAGLDKSRIVLWDRLTADLEVSGFVAMGKRLGVQVLSCQAAGYDESVAYTNFLIGKLGWTDHEFKQEGDDVGKRSFFSKLVTQKITKIVNVAPMLNHYRSGVAGCLYTLAFGAVDNTQRFESSVERLAEAVPEIYAQEPIVDKVVLNIVDALMVQYQGETQPLLHYSKILNQVRFSKDPVALDVLSLMELDQLRRSGGIEIGTNYFKLYQENAALLQLGVGDTNRIRLIRK